MARAGQQRPHSDPVSFGSAGDDQEWGRPRALGGGGPRRGGIVSPHASGHFLGQPGGRTGDLPPVGPIEQEAHAIRFGVTLEQSVVLFGPGEGEIERQLAGNRDDLLPRGGHQERLELLTQLISNEQQEEQAKHGEIRHGDG